MSRHLLDTIHQLGPVFAQRATERGDEDEFVADNYADLKAARIFSAMVPEELGGGGVSHSEMCAAIRALAGYCGSTALALAMHQHLVATAVYNYRHGKPGEALLRKVAEGEKVVAVTGGRDWLTSSGTLRPCPGGYRLSVKKMFVSGSPAADILMTSAQLEQPGTVPLVLHFAVPMTSEGLAIDPVWQAMGMRGTGSHNVVMEDVFIPAEAVTATRPSGEYHGMFNVVLPVALPLICAAYVGVAEEAVRVALRSCERRAEDTVTQLLAGEMENQLTIARMALESMIGGAEDLDFQPSNERANDALIRKTIVTDAVCRTTDKALEAAGGGGYFRAMGLERLLRDVQAAQFHPLPAKKQQQFTGRLALGLSPVEAPAASPRGADRAA